MLRVVGQASCLSCWTNYFLAAPIFLDVLLDRLEALSYYESLCQPDLLRMRRVVGQASCLSCWTNYFFNRLDVIGRPARQAGSAVLLRITAPARFAADASRSRTGILPVLLDHLLFQPSRCHWTSYETGWKRCPTTNHCASQICCGCGAGLSLQLMALSTAARILVNHHCARSMRVCWRRAGVMRTLPLKPSSNCPLTLMLLFITRPVLQRGWDNGGGT